MKQTSIRYQNTLFDMDGTITNSGPGVIESMRFALSKLGINSPSEESLRLCVGPSLMTSFTEIYHLSEEDARRGIEFYRTVYDGKNMYHLTIYDGIPELLSQLKAEGCHVIMVTSKPHHFAVPILEKFGLKDTFEYIASPELTDPSSDKTRLINQAIEDRNLNPTETVMIGDTHFDIEGAIGSGVDSIGVTYGYGTREELANAGATYLAESPAEIFSIATSPASHS